MSTLILATEDQTIETISPIAKEAIGFNGNKQSVDFNFVIQEALNKVEKHVNKGKAIIRCDNLPHIMGDKTDLKQLAYLLIDLILQHQPQKSKLFIYIKCLRTEHTKVQPDLLEGQHLYDICFHTNSCNESAWQLSNQEQIAQCNTICKKLNGRFTSAFGNLECLFKLTLPGKLFEPCH